MDGWWVDGRWRPPLDGAGLRLSGGVHLYTEHHTLDRQVVKELRNGPFDSREGFRVAVFRKRHTTPYVDRS